LLLDGAPCVSTGGRKLVRRERKFYAFPLPPFLRQKALLQICAVGVKIKFPPFYFRVRILCCWPRKGNGKRIRGVPGQDEHMLRFYLTALADRRAALHLMLKFKVQIAFFSCSLCVSPSSCFG
jgi:hypothetical protein